MNDRKPPLKWAEWKEQNRHSFWFYVLIIEWALEWVNYGLRRWAFVEFLEYAGKFTIVVVVVIWFMEADDRAFERQARIKEMHHRAYSLIAAAVGQPGNVGRREALHDLNEGGQRIGDVNLQRANLSGVHLPGADLEEANLTNAKLRRANLTGANLWSANLTEAYLEHANLTNAKLWYANLTNAELWDANLTNAKLQDANLTKAFLPEANLAKAFLQEANLADANLTLANLTDANLAEANLTNSVLKKVDLSVVRTLYEAKMEAELKNRLAEKYPHLFEHPDYLK